MAVGRLCPRRTTITNLSSCLAANFMLKLHRLYEVATGVQGPGDRRGNPLSSLRKWLCCNDLLSRFELQGAPWNSAVQLIEHCTVA